jgi:hypothetical protein
MIKTLSLICFALMTPNWVIVKLHLPRLSRDGISPSFCGGTGKRKSDCVKFAILALTAKVDTNCPSGPPHCRHAASDLPVTQVGMAKFEGGEAARLRHRSGFRKPIFVSGHVEIVIIAYIITNLRIPVTYFLMLITFHTKTW